MIVDTNRPAIDQLLSARREAERASAALTYDMLPWLDEKAREPLPWPVAAALGHLAAITQTLGDLHYALEDVVGEDVMREVDRGVTAVLAELRREGRR